MTRSLMTRGGMALPTPFKLSTHGLSVSGDPTEEEWEEAAQVLSSIEDASQWWIGDYLNQREQYQGEKYAQCVPEGKENTWKQYAQVAARYDQKHDRSCLLSWTHHKTVAWEDDRQDLLAWAESPPDSTRPASVAELRREVRRRKQAALAAHTWPAGQYGVIYCDPPWRPDAGLLDPTREIENQYPTMSHEELLALADPVRALALADCVLAMWTTAQKLAEAVALIDAWGFTVKSGAVWVKPSIGMGYWFRQRHELLILATVGAPSTPLESARPDSVIEAPRGRHSEKPLSVYETLESMFPGVPKVELFARRPREGWTAWGNE